MSRSIFAVVLSVALGSVSQADTVLLEGTKTLSQVLGGTSLAVGPLLTTDMSNGSLVGNVLSQAYTDGAGTYAYLYQVHNTGLPTDTAIEMLTLWPFNGANDTTVMGYLAGTMPLGFADGGQEPEEFAYVDAPSSQPVVSFYYTKRFGKAIGPTAHSRVMYVLSALSPSVVVGNIIGGSVGDGNVVGPEAIPEPTVLAYLIIGMLGVVLLRHR